MSARKSKAARKLAFAIVAGHDDRAEQIAASANIQPTKKEVRRAIRLAMAPVIAEIPKPVAPVTPAPGRKTTIAVSLALLAAITALAFALAAIL